MEQRVLETPFADSRHRAHPRDLRRDVLRARRDLDRHRAPGLSSTEAAAPWSLEAAALIVEDPRHPGSRRSPPSGSTEALASRRPCPGAARVASCLSCGADRRWEGTQLSDRAAERLTYDSPERLRRRTGVAHRQAASGGRQRPGHGEPPQPVRDREPLLRRTGSRGGRARPSVLLRRHEHAGSGARAAARGHDLAGCGRWRGRGARQSGRSWSSSTWRKCTQPGGTAHDSST